MHRNNGFTLIELVIVIGIVAILASIALPSYSDYVRRGKIGQAVSGLGSMQLKMEQFFQDNRTYVGACQNNTVAPKPADTADFTFDCPTASLTGTGYLVTATGRNSMAGFGYQIDQNGTHRTTALPTGWTGASSASTCWVLKRDGTC